MTSPDNMEQDMDQKAVSEKKSNIRTPGLTFTCILTFIGSGASAFSFLVLYLMYEQLPLLMEISPFPDEAQQLLGVITGSSKNFFLIMPVLYLVSLFGAIAMWKLRKTGFHMYTSSQLLMLLVPFFMVPGYTVPLSGALLTAAFIGSYGINLPKMR